MPQDRLKLVIEADNRQSSQALNQTNTQLGSMEQIAARVANSIAQHFQTMAREIQQAIQGLGGAFNGLNSQANQMRQLVDQHGRPIYSSAPTPPPAQSSYAAAAGAAGVAAGMRSPQGFRNEDQYLKFLRDQQQQARDAAIREHESYRQAQAEYRRSLKFGDPVSRGVVQSQADAQLDISRSRFRAYKADYDSYRQKISEVAAATDKAAEANKKLGDGMTGSMAKAMVFYQALEQGLQIVKALSIDSATYAAETRTYGVAMHAVAQANGVTADSVDRLEQKLKSLGITTQASRQSISQAVAAGIGLDMMPTLARMGQNLAVTRPDMTSSQVFGNLIYGIQSGQPEVLRTIGLNVNFERGYKQLAQQMHVTAEALDEQQKMQSRVNTVLREAPKFNGMYEQSLGEVGKQMQSMKRYAEEAKNAIGDYFVPAMELVVSAVTGVLDAVQKHPILAKLAALGGGAAAGAAVGAGVGALFGGVGAAPGAAIGAGVGLLGAGASTVVSGMRANKTPMELAFEHQYKKAQDQEAAGRKRQIEEERKLEAAEAAKQRAQAAAASEIAAARRAAHDYMMAGQAEELTGLAKINAEYQKELDTITKLGKIKLPADAMKDLEQGRWYRIVAYYNTLVDQYDEHAKKLNEEAAKFRQNQREDDLRSFDDRTGRTVDAFLEVGRQSRDLQQQKAQRSVDVIRQQEQLELARVEQTNAQSVAQKLGLEQKKLSIRLEFIEKERDAELALLDLKREIAKTEIAIRYAGQQEMIRMMQQLVDQHYDLLQRYTTQDAETQATAAREQAVKSQVTLIQDGTKRVYDQLKQSAEGIFDAMLTKSQSVWSAMANAFKTAFLTVIKEIVTSNIARSLASLITGQSVGLERGGGVSTGILGRIGGVLGGLGVAAVPVFAGGGTFGSGPVNSNPAVLSANGGTPSAGGFNLGGGSLPSFGVNTAVGKWTRVSEDAVFNTVTGEVLTGAAARRAEFFGKFGKAGGAVQSGLFTVGAMLGMDGLRRGGWGGTLETTMAGASIGTAILPGIGTAVGAGIGFLAGVGRTLFGGKSPEDKLKERIKAITGVDVKQKSILRDWVKMVGGDSDRMRDLWIRSKTGQDAIQMYADSTGQKFRSQFNVPQFSLIGAGGSLYEATPYMNGTAMASQSALPGLSSGLALDQIRSGVSSAPTVINFTMPAESVNEAFNGRTVQVIANNPRAVQGAVLNAQSSSYGRTETQINTTAPMSSRS